MAEKRSSRPVVGFELDDQAVHAAVVKPGKPDRLIRYVNAPLPDGAVRAGVPARRDPVAEAVAAVADELTDLQPFLTAVAINERTIPSGPDLLMRWTTRVRSGHTVATLASVMLASVRAVEDGGLDVTATHLTPLLLASDPLAGLRLPQQIRATVPLRALVVSAGVALATTRHQNLEDPEQPWQPLPPVPLGYRPTDHTSWHVERTA
ncbi:hypothetical protein [Actinophytocola sp.]|uniref:hypothetical protein n=1 Tax=Actinophytocola sp. TaxID=1872138 RepID=UPI002ECFF860